MKTELPWPRWLLPSNSSGEVATKKNESRRGGGELQACRCNWEGSTKSRTVGRHEWSGEKEEDELRGNYL